mgnify:CR=1 FL=1
MFRSLRAHLGIIFLGFLVLIGASVAATFLAVRAKADDAMVINLAGRQRMLTQKMTWLALAQPEHPDLAASIQLFDQTLRALRDGGPTLDARGRIVILPPAPDPALRGQLDEATQTWAAFRAHLQPVHAAALPIESQRILAQLDAIVSAFEARAQAKLRRLQAIQGLFLAAALVLLAWGYLFTRRRLLRPLAVLGAAARRIGRGDLASPLPPLRNDELGALGCAFETMRLELAAAREHLEARVEKRTRELVSALEFSQEIVAQLDLDHLLQSVTERARVLTRAEAVSLCLLDDDQPVLKLVASSGNGRPPGVLRQPLGRGLARQVIGAGQTVTAAAACSACDFLAAYAPGRCAAAPLRTGATTLGALCVVRSASEPFDPEETRALTLLANAAAIAITNARLADAGRRQAEQAAALAERERLAAELHDQLAQTLSFLNLKADRLQDMITAGQTAQAGAELARMKSAIGDAYGQVRAALVGLREAPPTAGALGQELAACVEAFNRATGLAAELIVAEPGMPSLSPVVQAQVIHIVREALTNVRRHAKAQRVWVRVAQMDGEARFSVEDDGCGFDPQSVASETHLGLRIMRLRAERSGGRLTIESAPGAGTKIRLSFPLPGEGS